VLRPTSPAPVGAANPAVGTDGAPTERAPAVAAGAGLIETPGGAL
jgi:hypothetical protein